MQNDFDGIAEEIRNMLPKKRFRHTVNVAFTASSLAMCYGTDPDRAYLAGLLHDCAKAVPAEDRVRLCEEAGIVISAVERKNPELLHAKLGAKIAADRFGITDLEILDAIKYHTTGRPGMTLLEKIIFTADYIEPLRDRAPRLKEIRQLAFRDIDRCITEISENTIEYQMNKDPESLDDTSVRTLEYYRKLLRKEAVEDTDGSH